MEEKTFLDNIDVNKVQEVLKKTEENVKYFQSMTIDTVEQYAKPLDQIMQNIYTEIICVDQPPLNTLEKYFLELSNCLYYMGDKLETLGIYDAMSKSAYKEVYNNSYLGLTDTVGESKKKPTVAELTAISENAAQYEGVVNDIYNKAYKILKNKVDTATTMLSSISKIISKRMTEMQLNSTPPTGRQILNEDASNPFSTGYPFSSQPMYTTL